LVIPHLILNAPDTPIRSKKIIVKNWIYKKHSYVCT
jgi:hypothetical protein